MRNYRMLLAVTALVSTSSLAVGTELLPTQLALAKEQLQRLTAQTTSSFSVVDSSAKLLLVAQKPSPLDAFPPAQKRQFIASVQFNQQHLRNFDMQLLSRELTPTEIYQVLLLLDAAEYTQFCSQLARVETPLDIYLLTYGGDD